jgi:hypothetical protein
MIAIPILFTISYAIAALAGVVLAFTSFTHSYRFEERHLVNNVLMSGIGLALWFILEGSFGPWTTAYTVLFAFETGMGINRIGKMRRLSTGFGYLILIEAAAFEYGAWHLYLNR